MNTKTLLLIPAIFAAFTAMVTPNVGAAAQAQNESMMIDNITMEGFTNASLSLDNITSMEEETDALLSLDNITSMDEETDALLGNFTGNMTSQNMTG